MADLVWLLPVLRVPRSAAFLREAPIRVSGIEGEKNGLGPTKELN
jgi:hypothetical protein